MRKKIVTIGGGTGSFTLLSGLKKYPIDICAIVSMADDGGSTGILRDELGVLPPGDVRQCLVALSNSPETLRKLINYRFENGSLKGHSFGNLFLSALEKINGSFVKGAEQASRILDIKGEVIPVSEDNMRLRIKLSNGKVLIGQSNLDHNKEVRKNGIDSVSLTSDVRAYKKVLTRIKSADAIVIGPGDLYGSILPIFLIPEIGRVVKKSKARVILNCNLTNKKGQTEKFTVDNYVRIIEKYIGNGEIDFVTFNNKKIYPNLISKYEKREGRGSIVALKKEKKEQEKYEIVLADLLYMGKVKKNKQDSISATRSFIRHDSNKLAKVLMKIIKK